MEPIRILNLQFRVNAEAIGQDQECYRTKYEGMPVSLIYRNVFLDAIPWNEPEKVLEGFDAVILGGSTEFYFDGGEPVHSHHRQMTHMAMERMTPFLNYLFETSFPTLGVCLGHHVLGAHRGAWIRNDVHQQKVGTFNVNLTPQACTHPLFENMPLQFSVIYGHKDCLDRLPKNAVSLIENERCHFSGIQYADWIYSVQFHPEVTAVEVLERLRTEPDIDYTGGNNLEEVLSDAPYQQMILHNFAHMVATRKKMDQGLAKVQEKARLLEQ